MTDAPWMVARATGLEYAIEQFKEVLPGWWYSVGECSVSCDASCGPDRTGPDATLLSIRQFDDGFHSDLPQPSTMADALRDVTAQAIEARSAEPVVSARQGESAVRQDAPHPTPDNQGD